MITLEKTPTNTLVSFKTSKVLKSQAQDLADQLGLPLSTVINIGLKDFVRNRGLVLSVLPSLKPNHEDLFVQSIAEYQAGTNAKVYTTPDRLAQHLDSL
jgi:antitoxin component of RelBE/YafQ-DinJ toxin-antitoxin module